jgi:hypothetical protein
MTTTQNHTVLLGSASSALFLAMIGIFIAYRAEVIGMTVQWTEKVVDPGASWIRVSDLYDGKMQHIPELDALQWDAVGKQACVVSGCCVNDETSTVKQTIDHNVQLTEHSVQLPGSGISPLCTCLARSHATRSATLVHDCFFHLAPSQIAQEKDFVGLFYALNIPVLVLLWNTVAIIYYAFCHLHLHPRRGYYKQVYSVVILILNTLCMATMVHIQSTRGEIAVSIAILLGYSILAWLHLHTSVGNPYWALRDKSMFWTLYATALCVAHISQHTYEYNRDYILHVTSVMFYIAVCVVLCACDCADNNELHLPVKVGAHDSADFVTKYNAFQNNHIEQYTWWTSVMFVVAMHIVGTGNPPSVGGLVPESNTLHLVDFARRFLVWIPIVQHRFVTKISTVTTDLTILSEFLARVLVTTGVLLEILNMHNQDNLVVQQMGKNQ